MLYSFINKLGIKSLGGQEFLARTPVPTPYAEVRTDTRKMRVYGICTTAKVDRSREIVVPDGVDWSEYEPNPIVTTFHRWREPDGVVGHTLIDGRFSMERVGDGWRYGAQFIQSGPQARHAAEAFALIDTGVLKGVSLGFRFIGADSEKVMADDGHPALKIKKCKPFEVTHLPVPDNPDAIVHVVEKGVGGRRLSQHWLDLLRPMVPAVRFHGFQPQKREKAMAQPMPDPAQGDPTAGGDPSMQQPAPTPAQQLPQTKPSIAFLMATEQYLMGFIRFLKSQAGVQDHPLVKNLIPSLILHLSQAYRGLSGAHQQIQTEDPAFPNMLGHGGLLAPDPAPDMGGAGSDPATVGGATTPPSPGFGDGLDDATGPEINAGMSGDVSQSAPTGGQLDDQDVDSLGANDPGDTGYDGQTGDQAADDQGADQGTPVPVGADDGEESDDGDDNDDDKPKFGKKGFDPKTSEQRIILIREKGLPIAFERARRMLAAFESNMKREFQGTDLNILRWASENIDVATAGQQQQFKAWCREKAMSGLVRQPAHPATKPVDPPAMGTPEYQAAVEAEIARLLAERQKSAV